MPYVLPKELRQRQKLNSLPDDLRKIAEELIGEKFTVEEVVSRKASTPSPGRSSSLRPEDTYFGRGYNVSNEPSVHGIRGEQGYREASEYARSGISIREERQNRSYIVSVADVSERTLLTVMHMMDMNNFRRRRSVLYVSYNDYNTLRRNPQFGHYVDRDVGRIYEFEVIVDRGANYSRIEFYY